MLSQVINWIGPWILGSYILEPLFDIILSYSQNIRAIITNQRVWFISRHINNVQQIQHWSQQQVRENTSVNRITKNKNQLYLLQHYIYQQLQITRMHKNRSTSSLSSFQNQQQQFVSPALPYRIAQSSSLLTRLHLRPYAGVGRDDGELSFSEFDDDDEQVQQTVEQTSFQIIAKLKSQLTILKQENRKLSIKNKQLSNKNKQLTCLTSSLKIKNSQLDQKLSQGKQQFPPHPHQPTLSSLQSLQHQLQTIKQEINKHRKRQQNYEIQIKNLKQKLMRQQQQYEQETKEWEWKDKFIQLFVDMLAKICADVDATWVLKKKIQVGWKIVKNVVEKAIVGGVKVPRVQGRSQHQSIRNNTNKQ